MDLAVDLGTRGERTAAIYGALVRAIGEGRLRPGDRLPPTRELGADLAVSRTTVATAYERLTAEGYLEGRVGAGTFVTAAAAPRPTGRRGTPSALAPRPGWTFLPEPTSGQTERPRHDFQVGIPDAELFPFDTWRRLVTSEVRLRANCPGTYASPSGLTALREAIARHLGRTRGLTVDGDEVVVTNGTQQALDLVSRVLLSPGDVVAVEDPGYSRATDLFASHGARVVPVPVDAEGLVVDRLPARAALVYTTPSHQFPLGTAMSLGRRRELLAWAERRGAAVVEDDYDSEFRFGDRPLEPLHGLDTSGRVLYAGTFSKCLLPSLRMGYLVAPPSLVPALSAARQLADGHGVVVYQAALARFMDEGQLGRHIRRAAKVYAARRAAVAEGLERHLGDWLELVPSCAGLHVSAVERAGVGVDWSAVARVARERDVAVDALADAHLGPKVRDGLVVGFGSVREDAIDPGLRILADVVRDVSTTRTGT